MNTNKLGKWAFTIIETDGYHETHRVTYTGINTSFWLRPEIPFMDWVDDILFSHWGLEKFGQYYCCSDDKFIVSIDNDKKTIEIKEL